MLVSSCDILYSFSPCCAIFSCYGRFYLFKLCETLVKYSFMALMVGMINAFSLRFGFFCCCLFWILVFNITYAYTCMMLFFLYFNTAFIIYNLCSNDNAYGYRKGKLNGKSKPKLFLHRTISICYWRSQRSLLLYLF